MAASLGDAATRRAALAALPQVARTGTHLFHFLGYVEAFRGWGTGLRRAVAAWYTAKPAQALAYQAVKYQQRDGWSHRDALRLAHPQRRLTSTRSSSTGWRRAGRMWAPRPTQSRRAADLGAGAGAARHAP
jgi:hypothetical protein